MSTDTAALVRRFYQLIDDNDIDGLAGLFTSDAEYHRPGYEPLIGSDRIARFYRHERVIREGRHTITAVIAAGDEIAVHGDFAGVLNDGRGARHRFAEFFRITPEARLARRDTFFFTSLV